MTMTTLQLDRFVAENQDATATLQEMADYLDAIPDNGGVIRIADRCRISGPVNLGQNVSIQGDGKGVSTIIATHSSATINVGNQVVSSRGPWFGGFTFNGTLAAQNGLVIGRGAGRVFSDMLIQRCTSAGVSIIGLQNSSFYGVDVNNTATGVLLDAGCKNIAWFGGALNDSTVAQVKSVAVTDPPSGAGNDPSYIRFIGTLFESGDTNIEIEAGRHITFAQCRFNNNTSILHAARVPSGVQCGPVLFHGCSLAPLGTGVAFGLGRDASLYVLDGTAISAASAMIDIEDITARVVWDGTTSWGTTTSGFLTGSALPVSTFVSNAADATLPA